MSEAIEKWIVEFEAKHSQGPDLVDAWDAATDRQKELMTCGHRRANWREPADHESWAAYCECCEAIAQATDKALRAIGNWQLSCPCTCDGCAVLRRFYGDCLREGVK